MRKKRAILKRIYRVHFLGIELILSFIAIAAILISINQFFSFEDFQGSLDTIRSGLYGTLAAISGAMLGFVITGLSILLTTNSTVQMEKLKKSKHYITVFKIFFSTSKYLGILLILSLVSLVFDKDVSPILILSFMTLWAVIIVTFRLLRCIWVLEKIVILQVPKK
ncbi:hypothetical protein A1A1_17335 [Planococcus antarcticus DSM 14505]|uniref:Uncharacterized protein n=1 Tax=Planococcus antarcticus DSM 14505 TaxID=1185653 RepID=A0AA87LQ24_9BACL|nr:hypothetical protein [Planococcus antarcticus]EIM05216.1 hypothetical protein A1A1_17335 [Planococcus antarcticus DSM 14505]